MSSMLQRAAERRPPGDLQIANPRLKEVNASKKFSGIVSSRRPWDGDAWRTGEGTAEDAVRPLNRSIVDINSAAEADIAAVGIDKAIAKKIVEGRPYRNKRDLVTRQLLSQDQYDKVKRHDRRQTTAKEVMVMYARMVIGEAISDEQVKEFARIYTSEVLPQLQSESGFSSAQLMVEEGGRMAVSLTVWKSRDDCVRVPLEPLLSAVRSENAAPAGWRVCGEAVQLRELRNEDE